MSFNIYKPKQGRQKRVVHPDGSFRRGMRYTDAFIQNQAVKLLVNQRIMDNGAYLTPRKGIYGNGTYIGTKTSEHTPAPHVAYYGSYHNEIDGLDYFANMIISFGVSDSEEYDSYYTADVSDTYKDMLLSDEAFCVVQTDQGSEPATTVSLLPARVKFYRDEPKPLFAVMNHKLYYLSEAGISKVDVSKDETGFTFTASVITGKEVGLMESTSIGFNMLDDDPYVFENQLDVALLPMGILPYTSDGQNLMLSANLGEEIKFTAFYKYKEDEEFSVQWEYALSGGTDFVVLHDYEDGTYVNGQEVSLTLTATDSRFVLRCTFVPRNALGELLPELSKVAIYPVYTLGVSELRSVSQVSHDLHKAKGIAQHNDMLVVWGVPNAEATLFFSDLLDASYFPFPHSTFNFMDEILHVESFAGGLFVFTERKLYLIEGWDMYSMEYAQPMFDNLEFSREDLFGVCPVKDGLFIRSQGKFFILAPNSFTGKLADMKLVPITDPVEGLLDDFPAFLELLSDRLYKLNVSWGENTRIKEYDFFNYVDGSIVKNVYRFAVYEDKGDAGFFRYQMDVVLAFNTEAGVWHTEVASFPYSGIIVQGNTLYSSYSSGASFYLQSLRYSNNDCRDTYNTEFWGSATNDNPTSARETALSVYPAVGQDIVVRVIDGDTVELEKLGHTRLLWINTPESTFDKEPYGVEASNYLKELLPEGSVVTFEFDGDRADLYDRALAWISKDGDLVQSLIARQGYVKSIYAFGASNSTYINAVQISYMLALNEKIGLYSNLQPNGPYYIRSKMTSMLLGNFQILDTGNRDHNVYMEKRYKEIQFMISNDTSNVLNFYLEFFLDARRRQTPTQFVIEKNLDENSEDYGTIYVTEVDDPNITVANEAELGFWELDLSEFPQIDVVKVIFRVSGKGHYPRFVLVSRNQDPYRLLNYSWVYRSMNAR